MWNVEASTICCAVCLFSVAASTSTSGDTSTDGALVLAARAGDARAHHVLVQRHRKLVVALSERILAGRGDAEDVAQDAFIEAFSGLHQLENPQAFAAWLGSIAVRRAGKYLRRQRLLWRFGGVCEPDDHTGYSAPPDVVCELRAAYESVMRLPPAERVALVLRRIEGMELSEIAQHMELSLATVKRRLVMGEARLARLHSRAQAPAHAELYRGQSATRFVGDLDE